MIEQLLEFIYANKIIAIARRVSREDILPLAEALYAGGIRVIEVAIDQNKNDVGRETAKMIGLLIERFGGDLLVGAGTVLSPEQVDMVLDAGARFVISPNVNPEVIRRTTEWGALSMPGALTPCEMMNAFDAGAKAVKLFPAAEMGVSYVRAVCAPLSHIPLFAVGGITLDNMGEFMKAGVKGFGIGNNLVNAELIRQKKWDQLTMLAQKYTSRQWI